MGRLHKILGYSGLVPFFGFALLYYVFNEPWYFALVVYSALIFSFLSGLLWASTLNHEPPKHTLYVSVGAMLWSFLWILWIFWMPGKQNYFLIIIPFSFIALHCYERIYLSKIYPTSFLKLRMHLSLFVAAIIFLVCFI